MGINPSQSTVGTYVEVNRNSDYKPLSVYGMNGRVLRVLKNGAIIAPVNEQGARIMERSIGFNDEDTKVIELS